jgi:hypothetical protein
MPRFVAPKGLAKPLHTEIRDTRDSPMRLMQLGEGVRMRDAHHKKTCAARGLDSRGGVFDDGDALRGRSVRCGIRAQGGVSGNQRLEGALIRFRVGFACRHIVRRHNGAKGVEHP